VKGFRDHRRSTAIPENSAGLLLCDERRAVTDEALSTAGFTPWPSFAGSGERTGAAAAAGTTALVAFHQSRDALRFVRS